MQDEQRDLFLASRERHPPSEAVSFVENRVSLPNAQRPIFDEWSAAFVSLEHAESQREERERLWKEVEEDKEILFALMEAVQSKLASPKEAGGKLERVDIRQSSWAEVMAQVDKTAQDWKNRPNKQGQIMVFIDKIGRHSSALESWLGLLPMGDYGASICGVFKLAIGAAGQYGKVEETIYETLADIPRVLEGARRYVEMYRKMKDQLLEKRTFELFRAILRLLRHIMQFFADGKTHKFFGSLMKQASYKQELVDSANSIKTLAQALNDEALVCQGRVGLETHEMLRGIAQSQNLYYQNMMDLLRTHPLFQNTSGRSGAPRLQQNHPGFRVAPYDWVNADPMVPSDEEEEASGENLSKESLDQIRKKKMSALMERLVQCLQYRPDMTKDDISSELQMIHQLEDKAKSKAAAFIRHEKFGNFIGNMQSPGYLLINGCDDLSAAEGPSPLSMVISEIARQAEYELMPSPPVFTLAYLCASHKPPPLPHLASADNGSAKHMIASLVGQLICQLKDVGIVVDLSFLSDSKWRKIGRLQPEALCVLFRKVMEQLPSGTIVMSMIDEVSLYETQGIQHDIMLVMGKLVRLATLEEAGFKFKLLVTCRGRAFETSQYFLGNTVYLEEEADVDDSAGWTISTLRSQRQR